MRLSVVAVLAALNLAVFAHAEASPPGAGANPPVAAPAPAAAPAPSEGAAIPSQAEPVAEASAAEKSAGEKWDKDFLAKLHPLTGPVRLPAGNATIVPPAGYYFLAARDARAVLEEAWGNPPDESTLGMILPLGMTPLDNNAWAAVFSYEESGYVSDKEAGRINYDDLMRRLQKDTEKSNDWREKNHFAHVDLLGWAERPVYDRRTHKMYWAKRLRFRGKDNDTLNYDIRVLGRNGVLIVGFVADISSLAQIKAAVPKVLAASAFDTGSRYTDFQPGIDKKAAYGLAGLIAGGAILKKTGLFAAILIFGKKLFVMAAAAAAAAVGALRRLFGGRKNALPPAPAVSPAVSPDQESEEQSNVKM